MTKLYLVAMTHGSTEPLKKRFRENCFVVTDRVAFVSLNPKEYPGMDATDICAVANMDTAANTPSGAVIEWRGETHYYLPHAAGDFVQAHKR